MPKGACPTAGSARTASSGSFGIGRETDCAGKVVLVPGHSLGNKSESFLPAALLGNLARTKGTEQGECRLAAPEELCPRLLGSAAALCYFPLIFYQAAEESFPLKLHTAKSASYYSIKIVTVLLGGKGGRQPRYKYCIGAVNNVRNKQVLQTRNLLSVPPKAEPATAQTLLVSPFILSELNVGPRGSTLGLDGTKSKGTIKMSSFRMMHWASWEQRWKRTVLRSNFFLSVSVIGEDVCMSLLCSYISPG